MSSNRENITAMLVALRNEKAQLQKRYETLQEREKTLEAWLAEERPVQGDLPTMGGNGSEPQTSSPLVGFLRGVLADGKPRTLQEITGLVEARGGLTRVNKNPGRVVHFALVGLSQREQAERRKDGTWVARK